MSAIVVWSLFAFNLGEWPSWGLVNALDAAPKPVQRLIARNFAAAGLYHPDREFIDYDREHGSSFGLALVVFYRRAIGKPLAYPTDPFGPRP